MPGDAVHVNTGAQHAPAPRDHVVQARVADHHPVNRRRGTRVLEVGFRAAEAPGVLIHVEQQHHAAAEAARRVSQPGSDVGENRGSRLGIG